MNDKQDARIVYADIISLPHYQSQNRPHMSLYDRAAQFAPFAALTGFDDMVTEEARLTDKPIELSEVELEALNRKMDLVELLLQDEGHPTLCPPRKNRQKTYAKNRMKRMTNII